MYYILQMNSWYSDELNRLHMFFICIKAAFFFLLWFEMKDVDKWYIYIYIYLFKEDKYILFKDYLAWNFICLLSTKCTSVVSVFAVSRNLYKFYVHYT